MSIDWFTFVAQIVNFLILVGLLRWLLYGPIVNAMSSREQKISQRWNEAEAKLLHANEMISHYESKHAEFDRERDEMMLAVRRESLEHRERLTREARDDVDLKRIEWLDAFDKEQTEYAEQIQHQLGEMALSAARHTIMELAGRDLEEMVARKFVTEIDSLDDVRREEIRTLLDDEQGKMVIRSAWELNNEVRELIGDALRRVFDFNGEIRFELSPELICGLQLDTGGYSIEWNADDFLREAKIDFGIRAGRSQ